jgi:hypothetical protein
MKGSAPPPRNSPRTTSPITLATNASPSRVSTEPSTPRSSASACANRLSGTSSPSTSVSPTMFGVT